MNSSFRPLLTSNGATPAMSAAALPIRYTSITAKGYVGKGFGDVDADWARPIAVTGEVDYTWSTHPYRRLGFRPIFRQFPVSQTPTVLTYGATMQYSLLYMNSYVHEVPEFFRQLVPDIECVFSTPVSNIGPSVPGSIPGTHRNHGHVGSRPLLFRQAWARGVSTRRRGANSNQSRERQSIPVWSPYWISCSTTCSRILSANRSLAPWVAHRNPQPAGAWILRRTS